MIHRESYWTSQDGLRLYFQVWEPDQKPQGVVCLVHGLGEHSSRYEHVAQSLTDAGYCMTAFDLRGHGKSAGLRGHSPSYEHLMVDIDCLLADARQRYPELPVFLYGHSMGGNLVLNYALRRHPAIAGVISTSPWLQTTTPVPTWKTSLGKILYRLQPTLTMPNGLDVKDISHDPEVVKAYQNDPLVHDKISSRLGIDMLLSGKWAIEHASEFTLPLLLVHGRADRITSPVATQEFAAKVQGDVTLKIRDGFFHETHNEPEKKEVVAYTIQWLNHEVAGEA